MDTQTQIDRLIELAIIQRSELKQLVEQLPQLRDQRGDGFGEGRHAGSGNTEWRGRQRRWRGCGGKEVATGFIFPAA